jgi:hypothetical protein
MCMRCYGCRPPRSVEERGRGARVLVLDTRRFAAEVMPDFAEAEAIAP